MHDVEDQFLNELKRIMHSRKANQTDFALHKGISRQAVNAYFSGRRGLLTGMACDLLEFLEVDIKLVPKER